MLAKLFFQDSLTKNQHFFRTSSQFQDSCRPEIFFFIFQDFVGPKETLHPEQIWVTGMRERNGWIEAMLNNLIYFCGRNTIISSTAATTTTQTHKRQKKKTLSQCCITMYIISNWQVLIHKYSQNTSQQVTFTYSQSSFFFGWKFLISFLKT